MADERTEPKVRTIEQQLTTSVRMVTVVVAITLLGGVVGLGPAAAAPRQVALPTVTLTALPGDVLFESDCKGTNRTTVQNAIRITVTRTGDTTAPLDVALSYQGTLASSSGLPDLATIPAGSADVVLVAKDATGGTLIATIDPSAGYTVGNPGVASTGVGAMVADLGCNIGNSRSEQTVPLGATPAPVDVVKVAYGPPDGLDRSIEGDVPPGTTFHLDGTWSGSTTELGTFHFAEYFCDSSGWCPYRASITVHVVPAGEGPPTPPAAAPPAAAIPGPATTFTG